MTNTPSHVLPELPPESFLRQKPFPSETHHWAAETIHHMKLPIIRFGTLCYKTPNKLPRDRKGVSYPSTGTKEVPVLESSTRSVSHLSIIHI